MSNGRIIVNHEAVECILDNIIHPNTHEIEQMDLMFATLEQELNIQYDGCNIEINIPDINLEDVSSANRTHDFFAELNYTVEHQRQDVLHKVTTCVGLSTFSTKYYFDVGDGINVA